jgi:predicted aminopeptidase
MVLYRFLLPFILLGLSGCANALYISKLGWHQGFISYYSVPVEQVLKDGEVDNRTKEKILFVQEVMRYGEERLGLTGRKNYSTFFGAKDSSLFVVTASEKDRLRLYTWNFPIVGGVTYKGFFTREDALKEKKRLDDLGYDTFTQRAGAYSTLGWLKDPIFSAMIKWDEATLANLILHETTHATIYLKGQTDFNEQLATFIGNRGAVSFLKEKYGPESREVMEAIREQEDDLLIARWIDQSCQKLSEFYNQPISRAQKLIGREEVFQAIKEEFRKVKVQLKTSSYRDFEKGKLNNAILLAHRRYVRQLDRFESLYERLGRDLKRVVKFFEEKPPGEDPFSYLEKAFVAQRERQPLP